MSSNSNNDYTLQDFKNDHIWVHDHQRELLSKYRNKWVAVRNQQIIDSDDDLGYLCKRVKDPGNTCVEYVTDEPLEMILWI